MSQQTDEDKIPAVARLYYAGIGARRYKRASVRSGPGEPLCFVSLAEERIRRARAEERAAAAAREAELRRVLKTIADQGPNYGPDGTRETWVHWSEIARAYLADLEKKS
jgi:hypothetical protein